MLQGSVELRAQVIQVCTGMNLKPRNLELWLQMTQGSRRRGNKKIEKHNETYHGYGLIKKHDCGLLLMLPVWRKATSLIS